MDNPGFVDLQYVESPIQAKTGADGSFVLGGLPPEVRLNLRLSHDRFLPREVYAATTDRPQPKVAGDPNGAGQFTEQEPVHTGTFTVRLERGYRLRARVIFADTRKPVAHAPWVFHYYPPDHAADAESRFVLNELTPGKHWVTVYPPDGSEYLGASAEVEIPADRREVEHTFELRRGVPVSGRVMDEKTGQGVAGVTLVYLQEMAGRRGPWSDVREVKTDKQGRFRLAVPQGRGELFLTEAPTGYTGIDVATGGSITEASSKFRRAVDISAGKAVAGMQLTVGRGLVICGRVIGPDDKPAKTVTIQTRRFSGQNSYRDLPETTAAEGKFELGGLGTNDHLEMIFRDRPRQLAARLSISPAEAKDNRLNVEVKLHPLVKASGRVVDGDGKPVSGAVARLYLWQQNSGEWKGETALSDANGHYVFDALVPGAIYAVRVHAREHNEAWSPRFTIKPGQSQTLADLTLLKADLSLSGVVVGKTGEPLAGVLVQAQAKGRRIMRMTDWIGTFRISGLPPGPVQISAWVPWVKEQSFAPGKYPAGSHDLRIELPVEKR
jgi:hypothetical protein